MIAQGSTVRVIGPPGEVIGHVITAAAVDDLPQLPPTYFPLPVEMVRQILREWNITRVLMIRYTNAAQQTLIFAALERADTWFDLRGQALTIEEVSNVP